MSLLIELTTSPTDDARRLIEELETELSGDFVAHQRHGYNVDRLFQPNISFFIARRDSQAVGCGGVAFEDDLAEIKRMYVCPDHRRAGIGGAILARLEQEAAARHVRRLVLETGDVLHPAIRMYQAAGYTRCSPFGRYAAMPPLSIARSLFLEKRLD